MMQCRSSPEGPPSRCFDPTFSVSPGCGGQDIQDPYGISLRSAPRPVVWHPCCRPPSGGRGNHPPPVGSSEIWHSPPGSAQPYQEDPGRSTQLITHPLCLSCLCLLPSLSRPSSAVCLQGPASLTLYPLLSPLHRRECCRTVCTRHANLENLTRSEIPLATALPCMNELASCHSSLAHPLYFTNHSLC